MMALIVFTIRILCFIVDIKKNWNDAGAARRLELRRNDEEISKTANLGPRQLAPIPGILPGLIDFFYSARGQIDFKFWGPEDTYFEVPTNALTICWWIKEP